MKTTIIAAAFLSLAFVACKKDQNCKCAPMDPPPAVEGTTPPPPPKNTKCPPPPFKPIKAIISRIKN